MVETWAIVDSRDEIMARCEEGAECSDSDQELIGGVPPYRVVHLVEAGTPDVCWHCHDALEPQGRPHCHRCPADGECDVEGCDAPGCRELEDDDA